MLVDQVDLSYGTSYGTNGSARCVEDGCARRDRHAHTMPTPYPHRTIPTSHHAHIAPCPHRTIPTPWPPHAMPTPWPHQARVGLAQRHASSHVRLHHCGARQRDGQGRLGQRHHRGPLAARQPLLLPRSSGHARHRRRAGQVPQPGHVPLWQLRGVTPSHPIARCATFTPSRDPLTLTLTLTRT